MNSQNHYMAEPASPNGKGVLVLHAWWGLNDFIKSLCDRLAKEGFVALAPDMYGGNIAVTVPEAEKLLQTLDDATIDTTIMSAVEALRKHPHVESHSIGVVGFSLGGFQALRLLDQFPEDIAALVIFYATWPDPFKKSQVAVQGHFAENDPFESLEAQRAMEANLKEAMLTTEMYDYPGTGHWFFETDRPDAYHAEAAAQAWERMVDFLQRTL